MRVIDALADVTAFTKEMRTAKTAIGALAAIEKSRSIFVSRGDDSGTHRTERALWALLTTDDERRLAGNYARRVSVKHARAAMAARTAPGGDLHTAGYRA